MISNSIERFETVEKSQEKAILSRFPVTKQVRAIVYLIILNKKYIQIINDIFAIHEKLYYAHYLK